MVVRTAGARLSSRTICCGDRAWPVSRRPGTACRVCGLYVFRLPTGTNDGVGGRLWVRMIGHE
jgi:hypothetical protein